VKSKGAVAPLKKLSRRQLLLIFGFSVPERERSSAITITENDHQQQEEEQQAGIDTAVIV